MPYICYEYSNVKGKCLRIRSIERKRNRRSFGDIPVPVKFGWKVTEGRSDMVASLHESFRVILDKMRNPGFSDDELRIMIHENPKVLMNRKSEKTARRKIWQNKSGFNPPGLSHARFPGRRGRRRKAEFFGLCLVPLFR